MEKLIKIMNVTILRLPTAFLIKTLHGLFVRRAGVSTLGAHANRYFGITQKVSTR